MRAALIGSLVGLVMAVGISPFVAAGTTARQGGPMEGRVSEGHVLRDPGQGGVEVEVTHVSQGVVPGAARAIMQRYPLGRYTVFLIAMDTHSVNLGGYDMAEICELRSVRKSYSPVRWEGISESSHHRLGALVFPKVDLPAELVIKTVAGVPARVFRWLP